MSKKLRMYTHPLLGPSAAKARGEGTKDRFGNFIKLVPRYVSPISHVIIPQTSGLDPNAHLTPLKGYQIRFKGKMMEKTLKSNIFKFRTGHTRRSDYRSHHYEEGYSVHGPFGCVGVRVYYEYELDPYFASSERYAEIDTDTNSKDSSKNDAEPQFKFSVSDTRNIADYDMIEDKKTQQLLEDVDSDL